ncbi:MAG TPA: flippase [Candidatus Desulfofervidus auxilii]|uniref:Flippase n=1 Tax=Desulfofervidus auxilii TaxID=1621989 RepID=A0A7C0U268_DESA2|nr:flippase [Candidatus Desulfofervidus auxilii]
MNTVQRIAKNTAVLLISRITSYVLNFLFFMYTARYLGTEGFGILSFALAFTGIFGIFIDFGLGQLTIREVARDKSLTSKYLVNISAMKVILAVIIFGLIALVINLLGYPEQTIKVVYLLSFSVIFNAFTQVFNSIFQGFEKMEYVSLGQILNSILMLSGVIFAIKLGVGVVGFTSPFLIASIVVLGYSLFVLKWKFVNTTLIEAPWKIGIDWNFWKSTIKEALPFGLTGIFITIYYYIDTVMLSLMVPNANAVIGWYNAAYRLILVLISISSLYVTAIYPVMSKFFKSSEKSLKFIFERSIKYMLLISIPIVIGTTLLADRIILLIFGSEYVPSIIALQILIWSFLFASIGGVFGYLLNSINRQATLAKIVGCGMALNIMLNMLFIPNYSYIGASIATDITRFFVISAEFIILSKIGFNLPNRVFLTWVLKAIASSLIMAGFIIFFKNINLLLLIVISILLYFIGLYLMKEFDEKDLSLVRRLIYGG